MTITLTDVRRHTAPKLQDDRYTRDKSEVSFELSIMSRLERATVLESIVAEKVEHHTGYKSTVTAPTAAWDITVDLDDKPVRVEVKSSIIGKQGWTKYRTVSFLFTNIKPPNFDYLFLVFMGEYGIEIKWCTTEDICDFFSCHTRHCNGYALSCTPSTLPDFLQDLEDFPNNP